MKYEWKPSVKVKVKKDKPVREIKVAKRSLKPKVSKSPDAGKENALQTGKNKKVIKKNKN